jgi:glycosyltransferase involved in cell wall biosynthesis
VRVVFADDGIRFDGRTLDNEPLGGVESSVTFLVRELAKRGHQVSVHNRCEQAISCDGVEWIPLSRGLPEEADLYIANRADQLIGQIPKARKSIFWIHNPANYLLKWRYLSKLWRHRPTVVFIGNVHATTLPNWVPDGGRKVIPYGIPDMFRTADTASSAPAPRAVFTSNPLRSLDWLLDLWATSIQPQIPKAELHIFSGPATYGDIGQAKATEMEKIFEQARRLKNKGVVLRGPVPKNQLIEELRKARVMLYRGDENETFCLAVGEAQALGVPAIVQPIGSVVERVIDGETGFVTTTDNAFADAAIKMLSDDELWQQQHLKALEKQRSWGWPDAAQAFEELVPS